MLQVSASCECLTSTTHETSSNVVGLNSVGSSSGDETIHKWRLPVGFLSHSNHSVDRTSWLISFTHSCSHKCWLLGQSLFMVSHQGLNVFWPCENEEWESGAELLSGPVKASLALFVLVQVFSRIGVGLLAAEGNVGQNFLLTSISCFWGAQESREEWRGGHPVDITPQQSRSVWMAGPKGLCPWRALVFEGLFGVMNRR